jgi:hypothetical protein
MKEINDFNEFADNFSSELKDLDEDRRILMIDLLYLVLSSKEFIDFIHSKKEEKE